MFQYADPKCFELILHQHIPMFHTAFCLFCAYLTKEPGFPGCAFRPRWKNAYEESVAQFVRRRFGEEFLTYAIDALVAKVFIPK